MSSIQKVAIVTGAGSGIGRAAALALMADGFAVALAGRRADALEATAGAAPEGAKALAVPTDIGDPASVKALFAKTKEAFGRLDVLFNNAGIGVPVISTIDEMSFDTWRKTLSINLDGVFLGLRAAIRAMKQSGSRGSIINTSSIYGIVGTVGSGAYNASKGGVRTLTKAAALECAQAGNGIRVNSVHPGHIETPMIAHRVATEELRSQLLAKYPVAHLGEPLDIANAVLFLASDESKFMTGAELVVDGGYTAQ
jgi:NAD(P)-dependent dehydrogenase (short-subunit alcohol dehydrogenase family)